MTETLAAADDDERPDETLNFSPATDEVPPELQDAPAPEAKEEKEEVSSETPPPKHSPDLVAKAQQMDLSEAEIEEMSPAELTRAVRLMSGFGQKVYDHFSREPKTGEPPAPKKEAVIAPEEELAIPEDWDPQLKQMFQNTHARTLAVLAENKALKEKVENIERTQGDNTRRAVDQRIGTLISGMGEEIAKQFNLDTISGKTKYGELMVMMGAIHSNSIKAGITLDEPVIFKRAMRALDFEPPPDKKTQEKKEKVKEVKEKWEQNSLGKPNAKTADKSVYDQVGEILKARRKDDDKPIENPFE